MSTQPAPQEVEAALFVSANDPRALCEQIAALHSLQEYRLVRGESDTIHDTYFDTRERALQQKRIGLRLRQKNAETLLTLKADAHTSEWGGVQRLEREVAWSPAGLAEIVAALADAGIAIRAPSAFAEPRTLLAQLGLDVIQERETERQIRNVLAPDDDTVLAELAIDALTYHFVAATVRCYEVEIEEKRHDHPERLRQWIEHLTRMYAPSLRRWAHSKLATGMALEQLLRTQPRDSLLDTSNQLKPEACDRIEDLLKSAGAF